MARLSKRGLRKVGVIKEEAVPVYKAALYGRISVDYDPEKSESVENQLLVCRQFVETQNKKGKERFEIIDEYRDYGKTGTNFERPDFLRLEEDMRLGIINCIIVKDLSRFARNYLEAGRYIEVIFPFLNVRFISVDESIDTFSSDFDTQKFLLEIKNLLNDLYSKDCSAKQKSVLKQEREAASFTGSTAPYGYTVEKCGRRRVLAPDEHTAKIVSMIYAWFVELKCYNHVADKLHENRINPPSVYRKTKKVYAEKEQPCKYWEISTIKGMIQKVAYIGVLEQGKEEALIRKGKIRTDPSCWERHENNHPAIVEEEVFYRASKVAEEIRVKALDRTDMNVDISGLHNIFESVMYCGICGKRMKRQVYRRYLADGSTAASEGYVCSGAGGRTVTEQCPEVVRIPDATLREIVMLELKAEFGVWLKSPKRYGDKVEMVIVSKDEALLNELARIQSRQRHFDREEVRLYQEYINEVIGKDQYIKLKSDIASQRDKSSEYIEKIRKKRGSIEKARARAFRAVNAFLKLRSDKVLSREVVDCLIERINVYPNRKVEICWAFSDHYMQEVLE